MAFGQLSARVCFYRETKKLIELLSTSMGNYKSTKWLNELLIYHTWGFRLAEIINTRLIATLRKLPLEVLQRAMNFPQAHRWMMLQEFECQSLFFLAQKTAPCPLQYRKPKNLAPSKHDKAPCQMETYGEWLVASAQIESNTYALTNCINKRKHKFSCQTLKTPISRWKAHLLGRLKSL